MDIEMQAMLKTSSFFIQFCFIFLFYQFSASKRTQFHLKMDVLNMETRHSQLLKSNKNKEQGIIFQKLIKQKNSNNALKPI